MRNRTALGLAAGLLGWFAADGAELRITGMERLPDDRWLLTFADTGLGGLNYVPESRAGLADDSPRQLDASRRITEVSPGVFQTIVPDSGSPAAFFQITAFLPPDADADGLSDELETLLGTSTATFDTDGDGFGDAAEILNHSDPLVAPSVPPIVKVNFAAAQSTAREGDGTVLVPVTLSQSTRGLIRYTVAPMSTASSGTDFGLVSGTLEVDGISAAIPIPVLDDLAVEEVKMLVIDLESDPDGGYQSGGVSRHTILLYDNDTFWSGVLRGDGSEQAIRLRLLRQDGTVQAALVSNSETNSVDGVPGVGFIPPGLWPMASVTMSAISLEAVSTPIPMGSSALFGKAALNRVLTLRSRPGPGGTNPGTNYLFKPNLILGTFADRVAPADPALAYLTSESHGTLVLMEDPPTLPFPSGSSTPARRAKALMAGQGTEVAR